VQSSVVSSDITSVPDSINIGFNGFKGTSRLFFLIKYGKKIIDVEE
jgi:hypothetical protein